VWNNCKTHVTHVQIAGLAVRNAPDLTNADEVALLEAIADHGYDGWISAEYMPAPADDPDWLAKARQITG
jgi:hydroxypyruvate isomerase